MAVAGVPNQQDTTDSLPGWWPFGGSKEKDVAPPSDPNDPASWGEPIYPPQTQMVNGNLYVQYEDYSWHPAPGVPQAAPKSEPAKPASIEIAPNGTAWRWDADAGDYVQDSRFDKPAAATGPGGLTAAQSADLGMQGARLGEDRRQFDTRTGEDMRQFDLTNQRMIAEANARKQQSDAEIALQQKLYDFNVSKEQFANAQWERTHELQYKKLAADTQAQMFTQQATIQNLVSQRDQANAQIDQANARMTFEAQQLDVQREENRQGRLQSLNKDTAAMAADPGDRGAYASFATLNNGWGQANTALARGADLRTDESLQPIQSNLNLREILGRPLTPTVAPQTPRLGALDLSGLGGGMGGTAANNGSIRTQANSEQEARLRLGGMGDEEIAAIRNAGGLTPDAITAVEQARLPKAEHGGVMDGAYISGERGVELNIPDPDLPGETLVLNQKQAKKLGIDLKGLLKNPEVKKMATGGIFTGSTAPENSGARSFLADSLAKARSGTPWQNGALPTPVSASSPGTSPFVAQLMASLQAQSSGLPQQEFLRLAQLYAPRGMNQNVIGRSR